MLTADSFLQSVHLHVPHTWGKINLSDVENKQIIDFIQLYETNDIAHIHTTVYNTASLLVLLNIFEDTMVKDFENNRKDVNSLYFRVLSQLFNSIDALPENIQDELQYMLLDHAVDGIRSKTAARIVKIPLIDTENTILIKCETKSKIQKEWAMIQKVKQKCGEYLIPYYDILDCQQNLCIFCKEKSNSIIVMKESGITLSRWILSNYNEGDIYFGNLTRIFLGVIDALYCLHQNGFYHGDVKPQNILITEKEDMFKVQLIDFEKSDILEIGKTTKSGTPEFKLHHESQVQTMDIEGVAIMIYVFLILRFPSMNEFRKYVKRTLPSIDNRSRHIFHEILSHDPRLEKLGYTIRGDVLISPNVLKMMQNYIFVLLGSSDKWFTKHDMVMAH